jgi:hypothetical protein
MSDEIIELHSAKMKGNSRKAKLARLIDPYIKRAGEQYVSARGADVRRPCIGKVGPTVIRGTYRLLERQEATVNFAMSGADLTLTFSTFKGLPLELKTWDFRLGRGALSYAAVGRLLAAFIWAINSISITTEVDRLVSKKVAVKEAPDD